MRCIVSADCQVWRTTEITKRLPAASRLQIPAILHLTSAYLEANQARRYRLTSEYLVSQYLDYGPWIRNTMLPVSAGCGEPESGICIVTRGKQMQIGKIALARKLAGSYSGSSVSLQLLMHARDFTYVPPVTTERPKMCRSITTSRGKVLPTYQESFAP